MRWKDKGTNLIGECRGYPRHDLWARSQRAGLVRLIRSVVRWQWRDMQGFPFVERNRLGREGQLSGQGVPGGRSTRGRCPVCDVHAFPGRNGAVFIAAGLRWLIGLRPSLSTRQAWKTSIPSATSTFFSAPPSRVSRSSTYPSAAGSAPTDRPTSSAGSTAGCW